MNNNQNNLMNNYISGLSPNSNNIVTTVDEWTENGYRFKREVKTTSNSVTETLTRIGPDGTRQSRTLTSNTSSSGTNNSHSSSSSFSSTSSTSSNNIRQNLSSNNVFSTHTGFLDRGFMDTIHQSRSHHLSNLNPLEIFEQAQRMTDQMSPSVSNNNINRNRGFIQEIDDEEVEEEKYEVIEDDDDDTQIMKQILENSKKEYIDLDSEDIELQQAIKASMEQSKIPSPKPQPKEPPRQNNSSSSSSSSSNSNRNRNPSSILNNSRSPTNKKKNRNEYNNNIRYDLEEGLGDDIIDRESINEERRGRQDEDNFFRNDPQSRQYLTPNAQERYQKIEEAESIRSIMKEQDNEYLESLRKDQELQEQKELERAIEMSRESEKLEMVNKKRINIPNEPDQSNSNSCTIAIVLPNSSRIQRRFLIQNTIQHVKDWLDIYALDQNLESMQNINYEFTITNPRELINSSQTLNDIIIASGGLKKILFKVVQID